MIPSAPGSWLKPISEKDKAAGKRIHCDIVSLTLVSPKILTFISPHDDARIRIGMARTLSTESSCNLIKFVQLGAERIPSCREPNPACGRQESEIILSTIAGNR